MAPMLHALSFLSVPFSLTQIGSASAGNPRAKEVRILAVTGKLTAVVTKLWRRCFLLIPSSLPIRLFTFMVSQQLDRKAADPRTPGRSTVRGMQSPASHHNLPLSTSKTGRKKHVLCTNCTKLPSLAVNVSTQARKEAQACILSLVLALPVAVECRQNV